jgi:creatinine amidohydrolase/Fe(II)-dependent formamide hydrolase-like protein
MVGRRSNVLDAHGPSPMKIVLLILVFVYLIVFFWLIWKSASNWRWYHMVLASFAFLLTLPLLPLTAGVLKSRSAWSQQAETLETQLAAGEQEKQSWINGVPGNPQKDPGVIELQSQLRTLNAEVGRVFRDLEVRDRTPNGVVLGRATPQAAAGLDGLPADPAADAGQAAPLATEGTVVYGFAEGTLEEGGPVVPVFYLGEYRVTQATPDTVTITPAAPLEPAQATAANQQPRWALYEMLPIDSHQAFIAAGSVEDDDQIFGRPDEDLIRQLLGNNVPQKTIDDYLRDGTRARPDDPISTLWVKIRFTKKVDVTVDSQDQRSASDGGFFDALGQAVDSRLQRTESDSVSFDVGDQLIVKKEWADEKIQQGEAELIDEYFVRPLNSYRLVLRSLREHINDLNRQAANLRIQEQTVRVALDLTNQMITEGQQRQLNLEKDETQIGKELVAIRSYTDQLESELQDARQQRNQLYKANLESVRKLEALQQQIKDGIEQAESGLGN